MVRKFILSFPEYVLLMLLPDPRTFYDGYSTLRVDHIYGEHCHTFQRVSNGLASINQKQARQEKLAAAKTTKSCELHRGVSRVIRVIVC